MMRAFVTGACCGYLYNKLWILHIFARNCVQINPVKNDSYKLRISGVLTDYQAPFQWALWMHFLNTSTHLYLNCINSTHTYQSITKPSLGYRIRGTRKVAWSTNQFKYVHNSSQRSSVLFQAVSHFLHSISLQVTSGDAPSWRHDSLQNQLWARYVTRKSSS